MYQSRMKKEYLMIGGGVIALILLLVLGIAFSAKKEEELAMFESAILYELGGEYSDETKEAIIDALNEAIVQIGELEELPSVEEIREILLAALKEKVPGLEESSYEEIMELVMSRIIEEYFADYIKVNEEITNLETKITTIQSEITQDVGSNMTTVEVTMKDMETSITEIKETIAAIKESEEMNNQAVSEKIEEIDAVIVIMEGQISELYDKSSNLSEKITSLSEELKDDLAKEMKAVEVEITQILTEIEAIQISIEQIVSDIESLVLEDEALQAQIDLALEKIVQSNLDISQLSVSLTDLTYIVSSNNESLLVQLEELQALSESKLNEVRENLDAAIATLQKALDDTNASVSANDIDIEELCDHVECHDCLIEANRVGIEDNGVEIVNTNTKLEEFKSTLESCFQSVSSGKGVVASAITDKGVSTDANASFSDMAANILMINAGDAPSETPSYTVEEYRHYHEGSSDVCGDCYTEEIMHVHTGSASSGSGCYTVVNRCSGTYQSKTDTKICYNSLSPVGPFGPDSSGNLYWAYYCNVCGHDPGNSYSGINVTCGGIISSSTYTQCSGCGTIGGSGQCNRIISYSLGCGKTNNTVEGYGLTCGYSDGELTGYDVRFN